MVARGNETLLLKIPTSRQIAATVDNPSRVVSPGSRRRDRCQRNQHEGDPSASLEEQQYRPRHRLLVGLGRRYGRADERHTGLLDAFRIRRTMMAFLPSDICCPVVGYSTFSQSSYHPRRGWRSPAKYRRQHPLAGRHLFATRLKAALLRRGIVGKARKMRLEARHGEIHECADLWNGKPTLRGNEVHGHCSVLVLR